MLEVVIPGQECFNEETNEFIEIKQTTLRLEHSLVSLTKWESRWHKPFLGKTKADSQKTAEETIDYIKCMTVTQNVDPMVYNFIPQSVINEISRYIDDPMTATWFSDDQKGGAKDEVITSEILYYQMITLGIPFECQKWHLNRLLTLIRVCALKNAPAKKMTQKELAKRNSALNAARRKAMKSKG